MVGGLSGLQRRRKPFVTRSATSKNGLQPLPLLYDAEGRLVESKLDRANFFAAHFAGQELGESATLDDIGSHAVPRQRARVSAISELCVDAGDIVSLLDFGDAVLKWDGTRVVGLGGVSVGLAARSCRDFVRSFYPLVLKQALCFSEPVQATGGELMALYKKGAQPRVTRP